MRMVRSGKLERVRCACAVAAAMWLGMSGSADGQTVPATAPETQPAVPVTQPETKPVAQPAPVIEPAPQTQAQTQPQTQAETHPEPPPVPPPPLPQPPDEIVLREGLVLDRVGVYGRNAIHTDAIEARIIRGEWLAPKAGDTVTLSDASIHTWTAATAGDDGAISNPALSGGYAFFSVHSDVDRIMLLHCKGNNCVYVNGELHTGDPYSMGYTQLPVAIHAGDNQFLFHCSRGQVWAKLIAIKSSVLLLAGDLTLPDAIAGQALDCLGAIVVCNAQTQPLTDAVLVASLPDLPPTSIPVPAIGPMSIRKVMFRVQGPVLAAAPPPDGPAALSVHLELQRTPQGATIPQAMDSTNVSIGIAQPGGLQKRTFISAIDGSLQYYALRPANPPAETGGAVGLILSLHGASVEATSQAGSYAPKPWANIVSPTNRRPFGFDWEDWGRLDAIEVLNLAQRDLKTDPQRTWLTGHSMGGHGTWQIGATFPDRFAAIAPSAGWISFWSYAGATRPDNPTPMQELIQRAANPSDTLALSRNYLQQGIYILHGDADDNVPVDQARSMRQHLAGYHPDFAYKEQPGAGHWWGNACVDWPLLMEFLQGHTSAADRDIKHIEFATASPGVSSKCHWAAIESQLQPLKISSIVLNRDPAARTLVGTTVNVSRLSISMPGVEPGKPLTIELDGQKLENIAWPAEGDTLWLARDADKWSVAAKPSLSLKGPHRNGLFKDAFRNRMVFVYGTTGTPEENAWSFAKARYDAETFWYRGNGSIDVVADTAFDAAKDVDRNVILYGNADTNAAWNTLMSASPVQVHRAGIHIGDREFAGDDLACLVIRPRPGSDFACVGAVTGTGLIGLRLADRLPYFISGVAYPDLIVIGADSLATGSDGVRAAGFFGPDWSMTGGEFVWKQ